MYGFFDVLGEIAGVTGILVPIFAYLIAPISEYTFYYKLIMKLFKYR
jgi:hypothetical protein